MSVVAYIGKPLGDGIGVDRFGSTSRRELTDWHGNKIGYCFLGNSWRVNSYIGKRMYSVRAQIGTKQYFGRSFGEGMYVNLRETTASRAR